MVLVGKDNDSSTVQAGFFSVHIVEPASFLWGDKRENRNTGLTSAEYTIIALLLHYITLKSELKYSSSTKF